MKATTTTTTKATTTTTTVKATTTTTVPAVPSRPVDHRPGRADVHRRSHAVVPRVRSGGQRQPGRPVALRRDDRGLGGVRVPPERPRTVPSSPTRRKRSATGSAAPTACARPSTTACRSAQRRGRRHSTCGRSRSGIDGSTLLATAGTTAIWRSVDGGDNWTELPAPPAGPLGQVLVVDATTAVVAAGDGIQRTIDGGQTWTAVPSGAKVVGAPVTVGSTIWWLRDKGAGVLGSTDGGATWTAPAGKGLAAVGVEPGHHSPMAGCSPSAPPTRSSPPRTASRGPPTARRCRSPRPAS